MEAEGDRVFTRQEQEMVEPADAVDAGGRR